MATTVTHFVDPNAAGGGDGSKEYPYTSLSAWEAAQQRNLVTADEVERVICSSNDDDPEAAHAADTTPATIDGWTVDATRYIQIEASPTSRASAVWSDNKYRLSVVDTTALTLSVQRTKFIGLQTEVRTVTAHWRRGLSAGASSYFHCRGCYIRKNGGGTNYVFGGIYVSNLNYDWQFINNIIVSDTVYNNTSNAGILLEGSTGAGDVLIANNTIIGFAYSVHQQSTLPRLRYINNISQGAAIQSYAINSTTKTCDYNISDGNYDTGGAHDKKNTTVTFEAGGYKLDSTDTAAKDAGLDLSDSDNNPWFPFIDDIDGDTRTAPWDIGADEYVAGGPEKSATLSGTITESISESDIVAGGRTIVLTLTGDTFIPN